MTIETEAEAFLAHYGKKGMRWGVRRDPNTGVRPVAQALNDSKFGKMAQRNVDRHDSRVAAKTAKKEARKAEDQEIINARGRQEQRSIMLQQKALATYVQNTKKGQQAAEDAYARAEKRMINHPDADTAAKMTHGEKAADRLSLGLALGVIGLAIGGAALTARG